MTISIKPPKSFWIIAIITLLWNLMGVYQFLLSTLFYEQLVASVSSTEIVLFNKLPFWYTIVFAIAVFAGMLGSITMLFKKKITIFLFGISLLAVLVIEVYWLFFTDAIKIIGLQTAIMPLMVIAVSIFLYFYSKGAARNGWIG